MEYVKHLEEQVTKRRHKRKKKKRKLSKEEKKPFFNTGPPASYQDETPLNFSYPGVVIINSKARGGKSHLIRYSMFSNQNKFGYGIAFSKTIHDPTNLEYIPNEFKHPAYDEEKLINLMKLQASIPKEQRPLAFVLFDDSISDPKQWNSKALEDAVTLFWHFNLFIIISTQWINRVPVAIREGATQVIIFNLDTKLAFKIAYESYGQNFESEKLFKRFVQQHTGNYRFLLFDKIKTGEWREFRCPPSIPPFTLEFD